MSLRSIREEVTGSPIVDFFLGGGGWLVWALIRGCALSYFSYLKGGHFFRLGRINVVLFDILPDSNRVANILGRKFVESKIINESILKRCLETPGKY